MKARVPISLALLALLAVSVASWTFTPELGDDVQAAPATAAAERPTLSDPDLTERTRRLVPAIPGGAIEAPTPPDAPEAAPEPLDEADDQAPTAQQQARAAIAYRIATRIDTLSEQVVEAVGRFADEAHLSDEILPAVDQQIANLDAGIAGVLADIEDDALTESQANQRIDDLVDDLRVNLSELFDDPDQRAKLREIVGAPRDDR